MTNKNVDSTGDGLYQFNRNNKSCKTLFVGDQGTMKVLRGVKSRSEAAYGWCAEVPGDMHTKGYLYQVCKKVMKPGGFMHILCNVLSRTKVNDDSFGQKKFQEQNLNRIEEAVQDMGVSFGMAAVLEFRDSSSFPSQEELKQCRRETGSHSLILLQNSRGGSTQVLKMWHSSITCRCSPCLVLSNRCIPIPSGMDVVLAQKHPGC